MRISDLFGIAVRGYWYRRQRKLRDALKQAAIFDPQWYIENNPDVAEANYDALDHYLRHGIEENRSPGPKFDARWYADFYKSSITDGTNAAEHYLLAGQIAGFRALSGRPIEIDDARERILRRMTILRGTKLFDPLWYKARHPDLANSDINSYLHFASFGSAELRDPGPDFNAGWYQEEYLLDTQDPDIDPLFHYLEYGHRDGNKTKPDSSYDDWLRRYHQLDMDDIDLLKSGPCGSVAPCPLIVICDAPAVDADTMAAFFAPLGRADDRRAFKVVDTGTIIAPDVLSAIAAAGGAVIPSDAISKLVAEAAADTLFLVVRPTVLLKPHALALSSYYVEWNGPCLAYSDYEIVDPIGENECRLPSFLPNFSPRLFGQIADRFGCLFANRQALMLLLETGPHLEPPALLRTALRKRDIKFVHIPWALYSDVRVPEVEAAYASPQQPDHWPTIAIIIPTKDQAELLKACVESVFEVTQYEASFELLIVDNDTTEPAACEYLAELSLRGIARVLRYAQPFNFASINNFAVAHTDADVIVFLNNDTKIIRPDWLQKIAFETSDPTVGAVGAKLLFPDDTVQHNGVVVGIQAVAAHAHAFLPKDAPGYLGLNVLTREAAAITGACLAMRRSVFCEVGGFDANLQIAFNDVALCLDILRKGYRNICISDALLVHYESKSRGYDVVPEKAAKFRLETLMFTRLYHSRRAEDPFYNPNLSLEKTYAFAEPPRQSRPWRYGSNKSVRKRIMMVSVTFQQGHGVAVVIAQQAARLIQEGYDVWLLGPANQREIDIPGTRRLNVATPSLAARCVVRLKADVVIVHTPPFFSMVRYLGQSPALILYDYGEPPANLFPDAEARQGVLIEKTLAFALARFKAAISNAIADENLERDVKVLPLANSHLATWSSSSQPQRKAIRERQGWDDAVVILTVSRFHKSERYYKGVDDFIDIASRTKLMSSKRVVIVLCGKGDPHDIEAIRDQGIEVFANVSDAELVGLYFAADIYLSFSKWEGYNLGIAQALAMGLPVFASKIPAHDAFGVETFVYQSEAARRLRDEIDKDTPSRAPAVVEWSASLDIFMDYIEECIETTNRSMLFLDDAQ